MVAEPLRRKGIARPGDQRGRFVRPVRVRRGSGRPAPVSARRRADACGCSAESFGQARRSVRPAGASAFAAFLRRTDQPNRPIASPSVKYSPCE